MMDTAWTSTPVDVLHQLLHTKVKVTTVTSQHTGRVLTIDPVTYSLVLYCGEDETLDHVFGHSVVKVTVIDHHCDSELKQTLLQYLQPHNTTCYSSQQLQQIRDKLKLWITQHRIPVELRLILYIYSQSQYEHKKSKILFLCYQWVDGLDDIIPMPSKKISAPMFLLSIFIFSKS